MTSNPKEPTALPVRPTPPARVSADFDFTVLIVDDTEDVRDGYCLYFEHCGARARTAADGQEALAAVMAEPPDIIILDLAMPKVTGWEVLARLKADPGTRSIPVIVVSGQMARDSALRAGADAYCSKPCTPDALLREIQRLLARKRGGGG